MAFEADKTVERLRAGVIGAGVFGGYHARKYASLEGVELAGVVDPDVARAQPLAEELGAQVYASIDALLEDEVDLVTVASPALKHAEQVRDMLAAGAHVYVEKPLAMKRKNALVLADDAAARGLVLQVGHQERFVARELGLFDLGQQPSRFEAVRVGPPPGARNRDVSVIWDLMIHDIDLALALMQVEPTAVLAHGRLAEDGVLDEVEAELRFDGGRAAKLTASRMAKERARITRMTLPKGRVEIDFLTREVFDHAGLDLNHAFADTLPDPLGAAVSHFVERARAVSCKGAQASANTSSQLGGEGPLGDSPAASLSDACRAVGLAEQIEAACRKQLAR